jgi:hypothetical protein
MKWLRGTIPHIRLPGFRKLQRPLRASRATYDSQRSFTCRDSSAH